MLQSHDGVSLEGAFGGLENRELRAANANGAWTTDSRHSPLLHKYTVRGSTDNLTMPSILANYCPFDVTCEDLDPN